MNPHIRQDQVETLRQILAEAAPAMERLRDLALQLGIEPDGKPVSVRDFHLLFLLTRGVEALDALEAMVTDALEARRHG